MATPLDQLDARTAFNAVLQLPIRPAPPITAFRAEQPAVTMSVAAQPFFPGQLADFRMAPRDKRYLGSSLANRLPALAFVIGIHVLAGLAILTRQAIMASDPSPLVVSLIQATPAARDTPPPPQPQIDVPQPQAIAPDFTLATDEPAPTAISVALAVAPAPTAKAPLAQATEARYDADYLNNPSPIYPPLSRRLREQGLVLLKVKVRADGSADSVLIERASGSARLDDAALSAVKRWQFVPAKRGNEPVESWVLVPIEFELKA